MTYDELLALIDRFERSSLTSLSFGHGDVQLSLTKPGGDPPAEERRMPVHLPGPLPTAPAGGTERSVPEPDAPSGTPITAPLVGTFYRSGSETAPPFVSVGDRVTEGQVLFIIEAMKMFNEIKSPASGTVRSIDAGNGDLVSFGQTLMTLEADDV